MCVCASEAQNPCVYNVFCLWQQKSQYLQFWPVPSKKVIEMTSNLLNNQVTGLATLPFTS